MALKSTCESQPIHVAKAVSTETASHVAFCHESPQECHSRLSGSVTGTADCAITCYVLLRLHLVKCCYKRAVHNRILT